MASDLESVILVIFAMALAFCPGSDHANLYKVGDSAWSIPPRIDFYSTWSSSRSFLTGDTLVFEFQSEFHNVMQVSRREYEACTADNPFQAFWVGPATVPLIREGVYYFICSIANYCHLGQKLSVTVQLRSTAPPPLSPPPASLPPVTGLPPGRSVGTSGTSGSTARNESPAEASPVAGDYSNGVPASSAALIVKNRSSLRGWVFPLCVSVFVC